MIHTSSYLRNWFLSAKTASCAAPISTAVFLVATIQAIEIRDAASGSVIFALRSSFDRLNWIIMIRVVERLLGF